MTNRERIMAVIRGEVPDRLPWVPRLDFWYRAHAYRGTLPQYLRGLSWPELADRLGVGCYGIIPDFTDCPTGTEMLDRALGIYHVPVLPYKVTMENVERRVISNGRERIVEYHTPMGSIRTAELFTEEMLNAGTSVGYVTRHAVHETRDLRVLGYIFSHLQVEPRSGGYLAFRDMVGDRGIVVGYASPTVSPIHHIMKDFMPVDQFFYAMHDCPAEIERLADQMTPYYRRIQDVAAECPAEVLLWGANYDDTITYPLFFAQHILPALRDYAEVLHHKGKYLLTHTDGENRKLLKLYLEAGFDVADSVCPYPMTSCRLEEIRDAFADRITIWGGIPSILLCPNSTSFEDFRRFIDDLIDRYHGQSRLILGVSDMVTADADWSRMEYITERVAETPWRG